MNKYFIIIGIIVLILGAGIGYRTFLLPEELKPVVTGVEREITIIARKDQWIFEPEIIEVDKGDKVILTIVNEDDYDHGLAIDAFGIAQRMPASATVKTEFIVTQEGEFPFYCSVPCGEGKVDGKTRTHFDMIGRIHSRSLISETSSFKPSLTTEELKKQTREAAIRAETDEHAKELGYDVENMEMVIDEENNTWLKENVYVEELIGKDYQAVYYRTTGQEDISLWVFVDAATGEVITYRENK